MAEPKSPTTDPVPAPSTTPPPADGWDLAGATEAVHAADPKGKAFDAVTEPLVQSSTYVFANTAEIAAYMSGAHPRDREEYGRYGNPTVRAVEKRIAALEGAEDALLFASGMAAITTTLFALVQPGQHVVFFKDGYRKTRQFVLEVLARFGVRCTALDPGDLDGLERAITPQTRVVLSELPTNPYLSCFDLGRLVSICRAQRSVRTVIDATFATPYNCRPISFGVDLVVHSATKYLAGHNDVLAGAVSGSAHLVSLVRDARGMFGAVCDPHAAFLVGRGLKTLALRMERHNEGGQAVAEFLEGHSRVTRVFYPGLASHADHAVARAQMRGFGGVVTFVVDDDLAAACAFIDALQIARIAPSFGGVETLVEPPELMSYYGLDAAQRSALGILPGLVRLSVGVEDPRDIVADVEQALRA